MSKNNPLKKFFINKSAAILLGILILILGVVWFIFFIQTDQLSTEISALGNNSPKKNDVLEKYNLMQIAEEISLILFSLVTSAGISSLLVEQRNSNKIIDQVFVNDFVTSDRFFKLLSEDDQKKMLTSLEKQCHFKNSREKAEMYVAVKEKLNNQSSNNMKLFYEMFDLKVICNIKEDYIQKDIIKSVKIKSFDNRLSLKEFILLSTSSPSSNYIPVEITKLKINDKIIELSKINKRKKVDKDPLDEKRGYIENVEFYISQTLNFSNKIPIKIDLEYTTRCPLNDLLYTCRMFYPCKKFDFYFDVETDGYSLNPSAFGFIDDAKNSPNYTNDRKRITIKFNDWIFPLDGVCVSLEKNVAKSAKVVYTKDRGEL